MKRFLLLSSLMLASLASAQSRNPWTQSSTYDSVFDIIASGRFLGREAKVISVMGRRAGFVASTYNDIICWGDNSGPALDAVLTGAEALQVVSSSAADDGSPEGTGVHTVRITYIDASGNLAQSAAITLNGTTPVATGITALAIWWMESQDVGTNNVAVGNIDLRVTGPATIVERIPAGINRSRSAHFMVPNGYSAYVYNWTAHALNTDTDLSIRAPLESLGGTAQEAFIVQSNMALSSDTNLDRKVPFRRYTPGMRLKTGSFNTSSPTSNIIETEIHLILLKNSF